MVYRTAAWCRMHSVESLKEYLMFFFPVKLTLMLIISLQATFITCFEHSTHKNFAHMADTLPLSRPLATSLLAYSDIQLLSFITCSVSHVSVTSVRCSV